MESRNRYPSFFTEKMGLTGVLGFSPRVDSCDETVMTMIPPSLLQRN